MKKSLLFLCLLFFGIYFSQSIQDLHGKWSGVDDQNKKGSFTFFPDNYVYLELGAIVIDGRNYVIPDGPNQGKIGHVKYKVDFSKKPFKFRIIASYSDQGKEIEQTDFLDGLIEFKNEKEILLFIDFEKENPATIDPLSQNTMIIYKDSNL